VNLQPVIQRVLLAKDRVNLIAYPVSQIYISKATNACWIVLPNNFIQANHQYKCVFLAVSSVRHAMGLKKPIV
jgi:hypothetical protein